MPKSCLSEVYEKLWSKPEYSRREARGKVRDILLIAEEIVSSNKVDEKNGIKKARVRCPDACGKECYVRFFSGKVKNIDTDGSVIYGDMKPNTPYIISGSTLLREPDELIITVFGSIDQAKNNKFP